MPIVTTSAHKRPRRNAAHPIAIVALVLVAAISYLVLGKGLASSRSLSPKTNSVAAHSSAPSTSSIEAPKASPPHSFNSSSNAPAPAEQPTATNPYVKKPGQLMLPDGKILTFKPPTEGKTRKIVTSGRIYECDSEGNWKDITPPPVFDNPIENQLIGLSLPDAIFIPGLLLGYDSNDVKQILQKPVVFTDEDSEKTLRSKQAVAEMKQVILEYMDNGGTFEQFVLEMSSFAQQERILKQQCLKKVSDLLKQGLVKEARQYVAELNSALEEQGFSSVKLPKRLERSLANEDATSME